MAQLCFSSCIVSARKKSYFIENGVRICCGPFACALVFDPCAGEGEIVASFLRTQNATWLIVLPEKSGIFSH